MYNVIFYQYLCYLSFWKFLTFPFKDAQSKNASVWKPEITLSVVTRRCLWQNLRDLREVSEGTSLTISPKTSQKFANQPCLRCLRGNAWEGYSPTKFEAFSHKSHWHWKGNQKLIHSFSYTPNHHVPIIYFTPNHHVPKLLKANF